jgi:hypothetical protein
MRKIFVLVVLASFIILSCSSPSSVAQQPTATEAPAQNTAIIPTATAAPTTEPSPTAVVNPVPDKLLADIQAFKDKGYIPTTEGAYVKLGDFTDSASKLGYLFRFGAAIPDVDGFVYTGHLKVSTAMQTSDTSACGIFFGYNQRGGFFAILLDKSRIYTASVDSLTSPYSELGKTSGIGRVGFDSPFEADFIVAAYQNHAYVLVNGDFVGEYSIAEGKSIKGGLGYGIISGTNKDYGTRCEATNASIWLVGAADTGQPASTLVLDTAEQSKFIAKTGPRRLDSLAPETYQDSDYTQPGTLKYTVSLSAGAQALKWTYGWCTKTSKFLQNDLDNIKLKFELDGEEVPLTNFAVDTSDTCRVWYVTLRNWPVGEYHFVTTATIAADINDGWDDYPAGDYVSDYIVTVHP